MTSAPSSFAWMAAEAPAPPKPTTTTSASLAHSAAAGSAITSGASIARSCVCNLLFIILARPVSIRIGPAGATLPFEQTPEAQIRKMGCGHRNVLAHDFAIDALALAVSQFAIDIRH